eukprot:7340739-Alexandrium_andersonii.AAC.1
MRGSFGLAVAVSPTRKALVKRPPCSYRPTRGFAPADRPKLEPQPTGIPFGRWRSKPPGPSTLG